MGYRERLAVAKQLEGPSSILIVVGREDIGELEAQVRGSKHAWDIRLISVDALVKLVQLKENAEGPETSQKIRSLLVPREYTRLDAMIDVMFTAAQGVESVAEGVSPEEEEEADTQKNEGEDIKSTWQFTDSSILQAKRDQIVAALSHQHGSSVIKKSRAFYWSSGHLIRAACTISKRYTRKGGLHYWYAYHTQWDDFLREASHGYLVLGCMDRNDAFAIPVDVFRPLMETLNITSNEDGTHYWHIQLTEAATGSVSLSPDRRQEP